VIARETYESEKVMFPYKQKDQEQIYSFKQRPSCSSGAFSVGGKVNEVVIS